MSEERNEMNVEHDSYIIQTLLDKLCKQIEQSLDSGKDWMHVSFENEDEKAKKEHRCSNWILPKSNHCVTRKL